MNLIQRKTLVSILEELPAFNCLADGLEELVSPKYGVISGFQDLIHEIEAIRKIDLAEIEPF